VPQGTIRHFDPETRDGSLLLDDRTEVAIDATSIEGGGILTSRIAWESSPVTMSADEALARLAGGDEEKTGKAEAVEFLADALKDASRPAGDIQQEAKCAGISPKSLRSAKQALGVKTEKSGFGAGWVWSLPKAPSDAEGAL